MSADGLAANSHTDVYYVTSLLTVTVMPPAVTQTIFASGLRSDGRAEEGSNGAGDFKEGQDKLSAEGSRGLSGPVRTPPSVDATAPPPLYPYYLPPPIYNFPPPVNNAPPIIITQYEPIFVTQKEPIFVTATITEAAPPITVTASPALQTAVTVQAAPTIIVVTEKEPMFITQTVLAPLPNQNAAGQAPFQPVFITIDRSAPSPTPVIIINNHIDNGGGQGQVGDLRGGVKVRVITVVDTVTVPASAPADEGSNRDEAAAVTAVGNIVTVTESATVTNTATVTQTMTAAAGNGESFSPSPLLPSGEHFSGSGSGPGLPDQLPGSASKQAALADGATGAENRVPVGEQ